MDDARELAALQARVKEAFLGEFVTPNGRDSEPTSGPRNAIAIVMEGNCVLISSGKAAE